MNQFERNALKFDTLAARPKPKSETLQLLLPVAPLADLNLTEELYAQYVKAKQMLADSSSEPLNQRAQTMNSIVSILTQIAKIRTDLYDAERLKKLEAALLTTLKEFPELSDRFLELYVVEAAK